MIKGPAGQLLRTGLTGAILLGVMGVAFGESLVNKANRWTFLTIESFPSLSLLERDKLVSEKHFCDEAGQTHRVFVFESDAVDEMSTCRVVVTDEDFRVTSSWNSDRADRLLNVGFMEHTSPPVLEIVRHDSRQRSLVCEHLCLHLGVLQSFDYQVAQEKLRQQ